jgi:hypothetical protein
MFLLYFFCILYYSENTKNVIFPTLYEKNVMLDNNICLKLKWAYAIWRFSPLQSVELLRETHTIDAFFFLSMICSNYEV